MSSAKYNLARLPMFGLAEYLFATQFTFEWTFGLYFIKNITTKKVHIETSKQIIKLVKYINKYDYDLYKFAFKLFFKRLEYIVSSYKELNKPVPVKISNSLKYASQHTFCNGHG